MMLLKNENGEFEMVKLKTKWGNIIWKRTILKRKNDSSGNDDSIKDKSDNEIMKKTIPNMTKRQRTNMKIQIWKRTILKMKERENGSCG